MHVLWGWLQIDQKYRVADIGPNDLPWARHHPHIFGGYREDRNTVYAASTTLELGGGDDQCDIAGWGVFPKFNRRLVLTDPNGRGRFELAPATVVLSRGRQAAPDIPPRPQTLAARRRPRLPCEASEEGRSSCWTSLTTPKSSGWLVDLVSSLGSVRGADEGAKRPHDYSV